MKQYLQCLPKCFHSAPISTILKDYNYLLRPQSSPFNVNITNKMPKFIGFLKSACRFGHSKEKMDLYASSHQEYCQYQKYLLSYKGTRSSWSAQYLKFRLSEDTAVYWKSKSSSNETRNKSLELVLEHTLRPPLSYFWTFWSLYAFLFTRSHQN